MATKRITFRLYPNIEQSKTLHDWRKLHAALYNACVYYRKIEYQKFGKSINYYHQQKCLPAFKEALLIFWGKLYPKLHFILSCLLPIAYCLSPQVRESRS